MRLYTRFLCILCAAFVVSHTAAASDGDVQRSANLPEETEVAQASSRFRLWVKAFRIKVVRSGISGQLYDRAVQGISYNAKVVDQDRHQTEFTKQIWEYLDTATSDVRIQNGKIAYRKYKNLLMRLEGKYGVDAQVIVAIWGLESAYGANKGSIPTIESLATLAFDGRRKAFFEQQLLAALSILQAGDVKASDMKGSWAGAMGHTQFMPTSFLSFAQDHRGDGKRDIWSKDPEDALASTANYLARHGWVKGQPWGIEVKLPRGFNHGVTGVRTKKTVEQWRRLGITTTDGKRLPDFGASSILEPAGHKGAAFIIFKNFHVLEAYNTADAYVIAVGHLGDRIMGGAAIRSKWPRADKALSFIEKREMQRLLLRKGFDPDGLDGIIGPNTIAAIRAYQTSVGVVPDGYASTTLLKRLR